MRTFYHNTIVTFFLVLTPILCGFSLTDEAQEQAEFVEGLKRDIIKVDHTIKVTKEHIKKSKGTTFLPDIIFRLAELYVEKSRLVYYLAVETMGSEQAVQSAESKLLKNEAITIYRDLIHRFPEYRYNDRVLFFLGHELHEMGLHEDMIDTYKKLIEDYPKSSLLLEALYIIGDFYFNQDNLVDAGRYYKRILVYRESPMHDMARYKLAWIAINHAKSDRSHWRKALGLFEQAAISSNSPDEGISVDTHKMVNIKLEAINGIVFCFTEVHPAKMALEYFGKLAPSKTVYLHALRKLANRYFIKEQFDSAAMIYRRIVEFSNDVEKNLDYAQRIYDASAYSKNKERVDEDVRALVKAASKYTFSWRVPDQEKVQLSKEFEVYTRDIVTKLHLLAQKRQEKRAFRVAARAYKEYLGFFDYAEKLDEVKHNYAESLFNSDQYLEAGRVYEDLARVMQEGRVRREVLYSAIQSFQRALANANYLSRFDLVEARQGMKQLGGLYVRKYPRAAAVPVIKFNVARMYYEQGEYEQAIESFLEYIKQYPSHQEVPVAGHLVLDCYKQLEDYRGLAKQGREFISNPNIRDAQFKREMGTIVAEAENREIDKKTLEVSKDGKEAAQALLDYAEEVGKGQAENVIYRSFVMAKEKRNMQLAFKAGGALAMQYPQSQNLYDVYVTLGSFSNQTASFERASVVYEDFFRRFAHKQEARQAMMVAARFHGYLGNFQQAIKDYRALLEKERGEQRGQLLEEIADAYAKMGDWRMVLVSARRALSEKPSSVKSQLLLAKALEKRGKTEEAKQTYLAVAGSGGAKNVSYAAEAQFRLGALLAKEFEKIKFGGGQPDQAVLESKMQTLGTLEQVYGGVVEMRDAQWAIASLYGLFRAYSHFAEFLKQASIPADLSAQQKSQYQKMLADQVKSQEKTANTYLGSCIKTVRERRVFGPYSMACIKRASRVDEEVVRRRSSNRAHGSKIEALKAKLLENPNHVESLVDLGRQSVLAGDHQMARLVSSKALEVKKRHAPALNLMGVVSLHLGEDQDAYDHFQKAVGSDSSYLPARVNLAALFMKYEDASRARAVVQDVLSGVRSLDLSASDVHPAVKGALSALKIK